MNPNLFEPIPASRLRRELRKVLRRLDRGEGPFRVTQRSGPDLVLLSVSEFDRLCAAACASPDQGHDPAP